VYVTIVEEYETGVIIPDELTVTTAGLALLQVPPGVASVSVAGLPHGIYVDPDIAAGNGFTVTTTEVDNKE
jgi:hypothetical protein